MENDYTIVALAGIFAKHADEFQESILKSRAIYKELYPDDSLPDHLENPFKLSHSLSLMCMEISNLKKDLLEHMENESIHYL
jgi:hypothetical protein